MKEVSPKEAYEMMQKSPDTIYLDVRSVPEFQQGHPAGAINIPIMHLVPGMGMSPNGEFQPIAEATLPKNAQIVIGCKSGGRSARACEILSAAGYTDVTNVRGGFIGAMDNFGRVSEPGWSMQNLPICQTCEETAQYNYLESKAKK